ncbi:MAG: ATP synthase F0 subunit B [Candidatus Aminicenantes bacterium]|nr:ATP synthase F0 subunit B [Candidatus Aminicenantes bacterium]
MVVIILISLLVKILNKIYFKPVGKIIDERENKISQDSRKLESMTAEIEEKTQDIEKILNESRKESMRLQEELIQKGEAVRDQVVIETRKKSKSLFGEKMKQLDVEISRAEKYLSNEIELFSKKVRDTFL